MARPVDLEMTVDRAVWLHRVQTLHCIDCTRVLSIHRVARSAQVEWQMRLPDDLTVVQFRHRSLVIRGSRRGVNLDVGCGSGCTYSRYICPQFFS